jgi:hypothetical protein
LRAKAAGRGMGSGMATVWRQRHRPGGAVGAACPCVRDAWCERIAGWRFGKGGPRRMDQRTEAGLGVRARQGRGAAGARSGRPGLKPFRLAPFDRVFLQLFQLKWTKWIIGKL